MVVEILGVLVAVWPHVLLIESIVMVVSYLLLDGASIGLTLERFRKGSHVALFDICKKL